MLRRNLPPSRKKAIKRTLLRRRSRAEAIPDEVRDALRQRSGGFCEIGLHVCVDFASDPHHRITQKAGGRHGTAKDRSARLSNLLDVCRPCHVWVTREPYESYQNGWSCKEGADTAAEPVRYRRRALVLLDDVGGWTEVGW